MSFFPLALLGLIGCSGQPGAGMMARMTMPKSEVVTDSVKQDDIQLYIYVTGRLEPYKEVEVRARIAGYLEQLYFRSGAIVKAGDRLALIEQDQYQVALDAAKAELEVSQARASLAKANLERAKQLIESRTISLEEFQSRQSEHDMALANVELSKTSVRKAELDLQYTDLRAPIPGKTTKNLVDVGNYISPTGSQAVLLSIAQLDPIYVDFDISDRQLADLKERSGLPETFLEALEKQDKTGAKLNETTPKDPNAAAQAGNTPKSKQILPALNGNYDQVEKHPIDVSLTTGVDVLSADFPIHGQVVALIDNKIDFETGQISLRGEIRNPLLNRDGNEDYMLYAGQICRVRIPHELVKDAILVHEEAILTDLDTKYVLLIKESPLPKLDAKTGKPVLDESGNEVVETEFFVERRDIEVGRLLDTQQRIVNRGLEKGETYIVKGVQRARIGAAVLPVTLEEFNNRRTLQGGAAAKTEVVEEKKNEIPASTEASAAETPSEEKAPTSDQGVPNTSEKQ